jgi:hypothetical protein
VCRSVWAGRPRSDHMMVTRLLLLIASMPIALAQHQAKCGLRNLDWLRCRGSVGLV